MEERGEENGRQWEAELERWLREREMEEEEEGHMHVVQGCGQTIVSNQHNPQTLGSLLEVLNYYKMGQGKLVSK